MIRVGDKRIVFANTFITMDNEESELSIDLENKLRTIILIKFIPEDIKEPLISWKGDGTRLVMEFRGWRNALGTITRSPSKIGEINGEQLGFQVYQKNLGGANLVHFELLLGGKYE